MNLLVIDVGNTSTAVGRWFDGRVSLVSHIDGGFLKDPDRVREAVNKVISKKKVDALAYLSVVPKADKGWKSFAEKELKIPFLQINWKAFPLKLDYPKPETIGADRLADAAAAVKLYGAPVLVCDFGTAFTAAAVTADGVWRGGIIAPGFPLMCDYFFERTAKLPRMKLGGKCPRIGRSTEEAMRLGAIVGFRGMVREIVSELSKNLKTEFKLVATGGFASWVLKDSKLPFIINPTLTLYGAGLLGCEMLKKRKVEK